MLVNFSSPVASAFQFFVSGASFPTRSVASFAMRAEFVSTVTVVSVLKKNTKVAVSCSRMSCQLSMHKIFNEDIINGV